jgi:hypothetical protein
MASFKKLVQFSSNNQAFYGDLIEETGGRYTVRKLKGDVFGELEQTEEIITTDTVSRI